MPLGSRLVCLSSQVITSTSQFDLVNSYGSSFFYGSIFCLCLCPCQACRILFPGTLILMLPDMLHFLFVEGVIITMLAMLSFLVYGYRVQRMSVMEVAMNYWAEFIIINPDAK